TVLTLLPWGLLADRIGERKTIGVGLAGCGGAVAGAALAGSFGALVAFLALGGALGGCVQSASGRAVMSWFAPAERGLALGIRQTAVPLGGAIAAVLLPALAAGVGPYRRRPLVGPPPQADRPAALDRGDARGRARRLRGARRRQHLDPRPGAPRRRHARTVLERPVLHGRGGARGRGPERRRDRHPADGARARRHRLPDRLRRRRRRGVLAARVPPRSAVPDRRVHSPAPVGGALNGAMRLLVFLPVDGVVAKLRCWREQGAQIDYLSSHRNPDDVEAGESYGDVAGRDMPEVLIED